MKKSGVKCLLSFIAGSVITGGIIQKKSCKDLSDTRKKVEKYRNYYEMLGQWISLKNRGVKIEKYFMDNDIHNIAIYGMGNVGVHLYNELKDSKVKVDYCIDQGARMLSTEGYDIKELSDILPKVDAIVVTACFDYENIEGNLKQYVDYPVLALDEILFSL